MIQAFVTQILLVPTQGNELLNVKENPHQPSINIHEHNNYKVNKILNYKGQMYFFFFQI